MRRIIFSLALFSLLSVGQSFGQTLSLTSGSSLFDFDSSDFNLQNAGSGDVLDDFEIVVRTDIGGFQTLNTLAAISTSGVTADSGTIGFADIKINDGSATDSSAVLNFLTASIDFTLSENVDGDAVLDYTVNLDDRAGFATNSVPLNVDVFMLFDYENTLADTAAFDSGIVKLGGDGGGALHLSATGADYQVSDKATLDALIAGGTDLDNTIVGSGGGSNLYGAVQFSSSFSLTGSGGSTASINSTTSSSITAVPEPSSFVLIGLFAVAGLAGTRRRI